VDQVARIMHLLQEYDSARKEYHKLLRTGGWHVTGPQVGVLRIVNACPGISISELAVKMGIHVTTAEGYAERLYRKGYIKIEADPEDRRRRVMTATESGAEIIKNVPLGFKSLLVYNLSNASAEEKEKVVTGLELLIRYLREKK